MYKLFEVEELIHVIMEQVEPHIRKLQSLLVGACCWTAAVCFSSLEQQVLALLPLAYFNSTIEVICFHALSSHSILP